MYHSVILYTNIVTLLADTHFLQCEELQSLGQVYIPLGHWKSEATGNNVRNAMTYMIAWSVTATALWHQLQ